MNSIKEKILSKKHDIIEDNNFLFTAFENRLIIRLTHILEKYKIPVNKNIIKKNLEENLINSLYGINEEIMNKNTKLLIDFEKIIFNYVETNTKTNTIKEATLNFINKVSSKNKEILTTKIANNFIECINTMIFIYDNKKLNDEIIYRINTDVEEIIKEFHRTNHNYIVECINDIIKNIIRKI